MKNFVETPQAASLPAKIFKVMVREDSNELGLVVAYQTAQQEDFVVVKGEVKKFRNETEKLKFLFDTQMSGFTNFETCHGAFDIETVVLEELVRRQSERDQLLSQRKQNGVLATSSRTAIS